MRKLPIEEKEKVWRLVGYLPSPSQMEAHRWTGRFTLVAGGERAGKSEFTAKELLPHVLVPPIGSGGKLSGKPRLFVLVGPSYREPRIEFEYLVDDLVNLGVLRRKNISFPVEGPCRLVTDLNTVVETKSAEDPETLRAFTADAAAVCEAGRVPVQAVHRLQTRVATTRGFILMSGTFEQNTGAWYREWFNEGQLWDESKDPDLHVRSFSLPTWSNVAMFPGGRDDPEIRRLEEALPEDLFAERVAAVPVPPTGLVVRGLRPTRDGKPWHVREIEFDPDEPVEIYLDPGYHVFCVLAVQHYAGRTWVVDELYLNRHNTEQVARLCMARPWWRNVRGGVADVAAKQHQALPSVAEIWYQVTGIMLRGRKLEVEDVVERIHTILAETFDGGPTLVISPRCRGLLAEAGLGPSPVQGGGAWQYEQNALGETTTRARPQRKNDHAWKALGYGLIDRFGLVRRERRYVPVHRLLRRRPELPPQPARVKSYAPVRRIRR